MEVICITTSKGGAAKSTNTSEIASALTVLGKKVLVIDIDQTCGISNNVGANYSQEERKENNIATSFDLLTGESTIDEVILETEGFNLIPGDERLAKAESIFTGNDDEFRLLDACEMIKEAFDFDYIFIDHGPQKDILQKMAYIAADKFLITTMMDDASLTNASTAVAEILGLKNSRKKLAHGDVIGFIVSNTKKSAILDFALSNIQGEADALEEAYSIKPEIFTTSNVVAVQESTVLKTPNTIAHKSSKISREFYKIAEFILASTK